MSNNISDITVNITVEDVVNPAAFGGICLYLPVSSEIKLPYTEAYNYDEAASIIEEANLTTGSLNGEAMLSMAQIAFMQENCPEKIGLLACSLEDLKKYINCDFRYLIPVLSSAADMESLASYIESCGAYKVLCVDLTNASDDADAVKYSDYLSSKDTMKSYERTVAYVHTPIVDSSDTNSVCTALFAKTGNKSVGSFTYKNQVLKGVYADEAIMKAQLVEYHKNNVNAYVHKAGYDVTSEGKLLNGEYIDILDTKDWLITQIKYQLQQVLIINDKIPYDNNGIGLLESTVVNILQDAYNNGMIAEDDNGQPLYTVNFAKRSETKASDREKRQYMEGKFSFDLAGAIHTVTVNGTINI